MTASSVEFFFDVGSPASYLAWARLPAICRRARASLIYRPMLLGGVFQATGNSSPVTVAAKGRYVMLDLQRHAQRDGVTLNPNPHFPINTLVLMRATAGVQLRLPERFPAFVDSLFAAIWIDGVNLNDAVVTAQVLTAAGFDPAQVMALAADAEVKAALRATTTEAIARGAFGAPTMFVGEQMFFGQDRLEWVSAALG